MATLLVPTRWGTFPARYSYVKHSENNHRLAVLFPGKAYTLDAPVMWYAAKAALEAGFDVLGVEYGYQANRCVLSVDDLDDVVEEAVRGIQPVLEENYTEVVFIGKSIGTLIQSGVATRCSKQIRHHVFLTPLRHTIPSIQTTEHGLVVVGDSDELFGPEDISHITGLLNVKVHIISGANHGLETSDTGTSIDILKETAILCDDFCRGIPS